MRAREKQRERESYIYKERDREKDANSCIPKTLITVWAGSDNNFGHKERTIPKVISN